MSSFQWVSFFSARSSFHLLNIETILMSTNKWRNKKKMKTIRSWTNEFWMSSIVEMFFRSLHDSIYITSIKSVTKRKRVWNGEHLLFFIIFVVFTIAKCVSLLLHFFDIFCEWCPKLFFVQILIAIIINCSWCFCLVVCLLNKINSNRNETNCIIS